MDNKKQKSWDIELARELYNVERWGMRYFDINEKGHVIARPEQAADSPEVDIMDVVEEARNRDLPFPLLVRFQDILRHRVVQINEAFNRAITEYKFKGKYRGVFPIKVNQLREVVEEILDAGQPYQLGIEAGSKPELFAALSLQSGPNDLIICNGYKDSHYIRTALTGIKLGKQVILVVEKLEELKQVIQVSKSMDVEPHVGIRVRLLSEGGGRWAKSGGENAKFGLTTIELLTACKMLEDAGLKDSFKLLHFHIGSQVPDIRIIKRAVQEATRYYTEFHRMGFKIENIDVGGGLGVDYDGSRTPSESSVSYSLQEYANDIVYHIQEVCDEKEVPHPNIISESGRAIVAHHSVLIVNVFGSIEKRGTAEPFEFGNDEHNLVVELRDIRENFEKKNKLEAFHDAKERRREAHNMFTLGLLDLEDKAKVEKLYWDIGTLLVEAFSKESYIPEEITKLKESLGDQYLCNFSIFQSLLDHWALGQLFPIMPLNRLNERPDREGTLVDITCDSDGQINKFIDLHDVKDTLSLHRYDGSPYYLGIFLTGAYQDIMGDLHNLFARVNEMHVFLDPDEPCGYYIEEVIEGTNIAEALSYVQYDTKELKRRMKAQFDAAIKADRLKPSEGIQLLKEYEKGLSEYTYLSPSGKSSS